MDLKTRLDDISAKLDRIDVKLDDHLGRISKAETSIEWIRGHVKISTTVLLGVTTYLLKNFIGA